MRPPFPTVIDSTMRAAFRSCPQKMFRMYVEHWKPQGDSVHLVAGAAFARGTEVTRRAFYEEGMPTEDAVAMGLKALLEAYGDFECPAESAKNPDRMAGALEFYFDNWKLETDHAQPYLLPSGKRAIEFSFAEPIGVAHPETGDPILYCGRSDMVADFAGGIYVVDEKTTSSLGASWVNQWELRSQFSGYCWAARRNQIPVDGVLVRGISILKTKYDKAEVPTNRTAWEIDRWEQQMHRDIQAMIRCWEEGYWDYALDEACTQYGGCALRQVCKSQDPESWLPMYFEKRKWDPLKHEETFL